MALERIGILLEFLHIGREAEGLAQALDAGKPGILVIGEAEFAGIGLCDCRGIGGIYVCRQSEILGVNLIEEI